MRPARILVVEDGFEYSRALERIADGRAEIVRAADAEEAAALLKGDEFHSVLLDVVFDRIPQERLAGGEAELGDRFGGDVNRTREHLTRQQGFYIADALASRLPASIRVVMAYDFSADPDRLEILRRRVPGLEGIREGVGIDDVLA